MSTAGAVKATSIGAYQLVRKIGEGGMGEVWEAEHQMIGRRAAIKFLLPSFTTNPSTVERFFNEARAVAVIADPGIIQIYDYGREGDQAYIVMELLAGEELSRRMKRLGRLPALDAVRLTRQIASSLASVHEKGVIHRDLKPDNIFLVGDPAVTGGERTKILDFGIAKLTQHDSQFKTQTGAMVGTPTYMSPEQCRATPIDHRSDIYSLGVMLFVMVTGRPPFIGEGSGDVLISHVRDAPPRPSSIERSVPREVETIIMRCLEKQPDARYSSATELCAVLSKAETFLASGAGFEPTSEVVVTYDPAPVAKLPARRGWIIGGVALALVGAGVAVVLATREPSRSNAMGTDTASNPASTTAKDSASSSTGSSNATGPSSPTGTSNPTGPSSPTGTSNPTGISDTTSASNATSASPSSASANPTSASNPTASNPTASNPTASNPTMSRAMKSPTTTAAAKSSAKSSSAKTSAKTTTKTAGMPPPATPPKSTTPSTTTAPAKSTTPSTTTKPTSTPTIDRGD